VHAECIVDCPFLDAPFFGKFVHSLQNEFGIKGNCDVRREVRRWNEKKRYVRNMEEKQERES
jgi:hypothetical protein